MNKPMQYQQLGQSDLQVSTLSLGCMSFHDKKPARAYLSHTIETVQHTQQALAALKTSNVLAGHWALAYCWRHPAVASTVVGASSTSQLIENMEALNAHPITEATYQQLAAISPAIQYENHR